MREGFHGGGAYPGPGVYPGPGAYAPPGAYPPVGGYPAAGGFAGTDAPAGWHSAPPPLHHEGPAGYGAPGSTAPNTYPNQAGYGDPRYASPQYPGQQHAGPYTYGEYAQVIREDDAAPRPAPPDSQPAEARAITTGASLGSPATAPTPVSPAAPVGGSRGSAGYGPTANPGAANPRAGSPGPGNPGTGNPAFADPGSGAFGYGPPGPEWYQRDPDATDGPAVRLSPETAETSAVRSPFEPLKRTGAEAGASDGQYAADDPWGARPGRPDYAPAGFESPDDFELDLSGLEGDALGQLHGLYDVAGTIPGGGSDEQFHQLLERQRKLIGEYFKESGGHAPVVPPPGPAAGETLAGTLGERLRGR